MDFIQKILVESIKPFFVSFFFVSFPFFSISSCIKNFPSHATNSWILSVKRIFFMKNPSFDVNLCVRWVENVHEDTKRRREHYNWMNFNFFLSFFLFHISATYAWVCVVHFETESLSIWNCMLMTVFSVHFKHFSNWFLHTMQGMTWFYDKSYSCTCLLCELNWVRCA